MNNRTPRIAIDCRLASGFGGLATYTRSLTRALVNQRPAIEFSLFVRSVSEPWLAGLQEGRVKIIAADFPHYSFTEQINFPSLIRSARADFLFVPHFNVPLACPVPFACTVHDLILHHYPNSAGLLKRIAYRLSMRSAVKRAQTIFTVSHFSARDLKQNYPEIDENKISVAYPGIGGQFQPADQASMQRARSKYGLENPYLLYVGNAKQHKNVFLLMQSFINARLKDFDLVLVTGGKEARSLRPPANIKIINGMPEDDLAIIYSAARGFVTASLYEGFCLPVLEAMACGCPVLAAGLAAIPEVAGGHALLAKPTLDSFTADLKRFALSAPDRSFLEESRKYAVGFDWGRTAEIILNRIDRKISGAYN